ARGADVIARPVDVTRADDVDALIREVEERWGPADAVVNNASLLGERGPVRDQPIESWRRVLDVNLTGTFIVTRAALPGMRRAGRGSIVNVSSGVGNRPRADWGAYAVSKWAVEALTYNLAIEERDAGIRANVVDPGRMRTAMRRAAYPDEDPATLPEPGESTGVFLWLVSDASRDMTGQRFEAQSMR
ncbi:MAG: SDR family NAD(P)-dependent oxidoreductase, partial [Gemmatimonadota bacterium]